MALALTRLGSTAWLGPLMVGAGAWCALGDVSVVAPGSTSVRLVVPASVWWFPLLVAVACAWPAWRRYPALGSPALLATVSWWPIPIPAAGLLWTGRLAWIPIGLSVAAALVATHKHAGAHATGPHMSAGAEPNPARSEVPSALCAGLLSAVILTGTAVWLAPRLPGGDEPHYLVITQSLLFDGDLRIGNNHDARHYESYYAGTLRPDRIRDGKNGEIYSIHAPGTSVLVLPAFAVFGYSGAQATIASLAAVTAALVWLAAFRLTGSRSAAWFAWTLLSTSSTFLIQGVTVFPDGPGALATAAAALAIVTPTTFATRRGFLVILGVLLAGLPWLHTRFAVIALTLAGLMVWRLVTQERRRDWPRDLVALFAVPAVSALAWFGYFWAIYGTFNPSAPYGSSPEARFAYVPGGLTALLFDQQFGLIVYSPAFALAVCALRPSAFAETAGRRVAALLAAAVIYMAAVTTYWMWWAGIPAPPARFAAAVLPVLAIAASWGWSRLGSRARALWLLVLLVAIGNTMSALVPGRGLFAWNFRQTPRALWLDWWNTVVDLPRALPSFFWRLKPGDVWSETHFAIHVIIWIGCATVALAVASAMKARSSQAPPITIPVQRVWALAIGLMTATQLGWWWNGVDGLNAASSQSVLLRHLAEGRTSWRVASGSVERVPQHVVRLRPTRADASDGSPISWLPLPPLPAGRYSVTLTIARPVAGRLSVTADRTSVAAFDVQATSRQSFGLALSTPVDRLLFRADEPLATWVRGLEVESLPAGESQTPADRRPAGQ